MTFGATGLGSTELSKIHPRFSDVEASPREFGQGLSWRSSPPARKCDGQERLDPPTQHWLHLQMGTRPR